MSGLIQRFVTAVFFVIVILLGLYTGRYSFVLLFTIITALSLWEFYGLVLAKNNRRDWIRILLGIILGLTPMIIASLLQLKLMKNPDHFIALTSFLFFPIVFLAFIYELYSRSAQPFTNVAYLILGVAYIGIPFAMLDFIAFDGEVFNANIVFGLLLLTWSNDTAAFVIGSKLGRTPLFPRISPKKTWEGSIGGFVITMGIAVILSRFFPGFTLMNWLILSLIVVVFGSFGDLVESMLKRSVDIKDSGSILPGHGGMLDRFDAFIFLLPYATAYLLWIR